MAQSRFSITHPFEKFVVAVLAATLAVLVRGLFNPIMAGDHAFVIPLLSVVFVAWYCGLWPGLVTLFISMVAVIYFYIEPKNSLFINKYSDQVAVAFFLFAGFACSLLGQAQLNNSRRVTRNLYTSQVKQRELEALTLQLMTSQRQTAESLAQLDTFVMNAPLGMAFLDRELRLVRINKQLAEANGLNIETDLGKPLTEAVPDLPVEQLEEYLQVLATGEAVTNRLVVGQPDSPMVAGRVWESSYYPVRQPDGNLLGVGVVTREISQKLHDEQALKESEARFRSLAEAMPQIVWVTLADGFVEYFNSNWFHHTGRTELESLGSAWMDALHPDDRESTAERWNKATSSGQPYEVNYRFRGATGDYRWFLGRGLPQRDDAGTIIRWFGTCTDIDDAKRIADALKESERLLQLSHTELEQRVAVRTVELSGAISALQDEVGFRLKAEKQSAASAVELLRSNGELEQFAYVASHDLQEPLRKIQAFGDRLKIKCAPQLGPDGIDYIDRMMASSTRMRQLINDLLAFSRLTSKPRVFGPVNLATIAAGVLSDLEIRIQQTGAQVDVGFLQIIDADPLQMRQLFQNLLSNALKFIKPDVPPSIAIHGEVVPGVRPLLQLQFRDNGIGFDVKYLDRIFQMFQRLHGRGDYEGTGVGLAICHKIADLHGGEITAMSNPGDGATFVVTLPVCQPITSIDTYEN